MALDVRKLLRAHPLWVVALGPAALFGPTLLAGQALFWGVPLLQFVPWRVFALETLSRGHLPLWNPWLGMGAPLLANYQSAILYPPNLLLGVTGVAWGHGLLVLLHLCWAGAGMALLTRRLGIGELGQAISGLAFGLSGYLVARAGFLTINAAASWLPWIIIATDRLATCAAPTARSTKAGRAILTLALALALQWLSGHAQTSWYTLVLALAWSGWRGSSVRGRTGIVRALFGFLAAGLGAFILAAIQLLPTLEYLKMSQRAASVDAELGLTYSLWPWRLLGLVFPDLFGNPVRGDYWGYANYWEDALYIGVLPFLLALSAAVRSLRGRTERRGLCTPLIVVFVCACLLALGKNTPLFPFLFRYVPTFSMFQAPTRWMILGVFALAILAGVGADEWRQPTGRLLYWTRLGTAGAAFVAVPAWLATFLLPNLEPTMVRAFALAGIVLSASGLLSLLQPKHLSGLWTTVALGVVLADLVVAGWGLNPAVGPDLFRRESTLPAVAQGGHRLYMPPKLEYELKFSHFFRFEAFAPIVPWAEVRNAGLPNVTMLDHLSSANNFDPILPERYTTWMEALEAARGPQQDTLLALMDVGWRAVPDEGLGSGARYKPIKDASRLRVVPQSRWVHDGGDALAAMTGEGFDPEAEIILEGIPDEEVQARGEAGEAFLLPEENPNKVRARVVAPSGGWLVLSDVAYPGWQASVDGKKATLYKADYLFRAVRVTEGEHEVEFSYSPISFLVGCVLSGLGWLGAAFLGWRWRRV